MDSQLSPAVDKMEPLVAMLIKTDMSSLQESPEKDNASYAGSGSSDAFTVTAEPYEFPAAVERKKKPGIPCLLPFRANGVTPCQEPTFTTFDNLKKHWRRYHSEKQMPKCPKGGKPEGYEDWEEDSGPLVKCM